MPSRLQSRLTELVLYHVVAVDPRYAWAFGDAFQLGTLIEKWNGISWQQLPNPVP